jgi:CrcB protein
VESFVRILLIALGGAAGTLARYGTGTLLRPLMERSPFPYATLAVNLLGCFVMGVLQGLFVARWVPDPKIRLAMTVGFLGGYTTFSSYGWETSAFLQDGQWKAAAINIAANNLIGIPLVLLGYALTTVRG